MVTLCEVYPTEAVARNGAEALRSGGVPGRDIRLLTGCRLRDVRDEPVGGFAGPVAPDAPVGTYAPTRRLRRQGAGTFAGNGDRQRQGSFADTDRDVIVSYEGGADHRRIAGDLGLRRVLRSVALDAPAADRAVDQIHTGRAVLVAEVAEITPGEARARLEHVAPAA